MSEEYRRKLLSRRQVRSGDFGVESGPWKGPSVSSLRPLSEYEQARWQRVWLTSRVTVRAAESAVYWRCYGSYAGKVGCLPALLLESYESGDFLTSA